jgi:16S rRNA (uracil1498-N3)-methyltransferase
VHRFYLPTAQVQDPTLFLTGGEAHHACHVLRVRRGGPVVVLDGVGHEFFCEVRDCDRDKVCLKVNRVQTQAAPLRRVTLLQALPKGKLIEAIIQKATELGASRIVPLLTERVVVQLHDQDVARKASRLQSVAIEAIKQCGSSWLPEVEAPQTPEQFLARPEACELALIASLQAGSRPARECFRAFQAEHGRNPHSVAVWIGPEGDFTPSEMQTIEAHGVRPITLGQLVLRTETAAIYCLSIINYELQSPPG